MRPFAIRGIGEAWLAMLQPWLGSQLFYLRGDREPLGRRLAHEVEAHIHLLKHSDRGRAFLRIMRGFELTAGEAALPVGRASPSAHGRPASSGASATRRSGLDRLRVVERSWRSDDTILLPAKHFLQEDQAPAIANAIGDLAAPLG